MTELKRILIERLVDKGIEPQLMAGFMRSLANSFAYESHTSLSRINDRLSYMGWEGFELDYHTYELIQNCFESEGLKRMSYVPPKWFLNTFVGFETDAVYAYEQDGPVEDVLLVY